MVFHLSSLNFSHCILPTLSSLLGLVPLRLRLHHGDRGGGGGGEAGGRGRDDDNRDHIRGHLLRPEAPPDQLKVDCLACVSEHLHCLLIGVSLDVYAIDLQRAIIREAMD